MALPEKWQKAIDRHLYRIFGLILSLNLAVAWQLFRQPIVAMLFIRLFETYVRAHYPHSADHMGRSHYSSRSIGWTVHSNRRNKQNSVTASVVWSVTTVRWRLRGFRGRAMAGYGWEATLMLSASANNCFLYASLFSFLASAPWKKARAKIQYGEGNIVEETAVRYWAECYINCTADAAGFHSLRSTLASCSVYYRRAIVYR